MEVYDLVERIKNELSGAEARQALALCLRFFSAANEKEFITIYNDIMEAYNEKPIDPLAFVYHSLAARIQERIMLLNASVIWARQQNAKTTAVNLEPVEWEVTLKTSENDYYKIKARRQNPEVDERLIVITNAQGEVSELFSEWHYSDWIDH